MPLVFLLIFIVGALVGGVAHRQYSRRSAGSVFMSPDTEEAEQLRAEAAVAVAQRIDKRKLRILAAAQREGSITNDGVEDLFCISDRTASVYLKQLMEEGSLKRQGTGRGTFYTPT